MENICSQKPIRSIFIWKNYSTHFFWMKIVSFCRFLDQIRLQKSVGTKNVFLNPIFKYLQFTKEIIDNMCGLSYKKINKWLQKHFSWMWRRKNNKTFCQKKFFFKFKNAKIAPLNTLKLFFWQKCFIIFFSVVELMVFLFITIIISDGVGIWWVCYRRAYPV